ncbi:MAG: anthranilate phosphoribosyltransferase [Actinobacteria bacterium]|nr:MAG: anthranilate phosphoribosyltransferase [Actinomycetota bacterium]
MIVDAIRSVVEKKDLDFDTARAVMNEIMSGQATEAQIAALITALRMKTETTEEISAFAQVMREKATPINPKARGLLDTCGTGGDSSGTFNISTTVAFVVAGCKIAVAKHGNRGVSSGSGSADVLEALGVNIGLSAEQIAQAIDEVGIGFLFAPALHGAMKYAIGPRRQIGIRTVFNILGPLTNPAGAKNQLLGVYDPKLTKTMAEVLQKLGSESAMVVHGDGLDELSTTGTNQIYQLSEGKITSYQIEPEELGLARVSIDELKGGSPKENAEITSAILKGQPGAKQDIVLLNSAAALVAAQKTSNIEEGLKLAKESIDSGAANKKLEDLIAFTKKLLK